MAQHGANGFLLVTTTTVSTAAKSLLDGLDRNNGTHIRTLVWDSAELKQMLLEPSNEDLLEQFLPKSYQRIRGLTSLEGAVLAFQDQLPEEVLARVMQLVRPYSTSILKGEALWPYDQVSAEAIDNIVKKLLVENDTEGAVAATDQIEYDAYVTLVNMLAHKHHDECREYLLATVKHHNDADLRFNAAQLIFDNYELTSEENLKVATHLDYDALEELYSGELSYFVSSELYIDTSSYGIDNTLTSLPGWPQIDEIHVERTWFDPHPEDQRVSFSGEIEMSIDFIFDGENMGGKVFLVYSLVSLTNPACI